MDLLVNMFQSERDWNNSMHHDLRIKVNLLMLQTKCLLGRAIMLSISEQSGMSGHLWFDVVSNFKMCKQR